MGNVSLDDYNYFRDMPINWGDMDAFNHVNNCNYFKFFENARISYFEKLQSVNFLSSNIGPILASTSCKYIHPITYPDKIKVGVKVLTIHDDFMIQDYLIYSTKDQCINAHGTGKIVCYDYSQLKKVFIPLAIKEEISTFEKI